MKKTLEQLLALDAEIEYVEYKEAKHSYDADKLGRYFSAISNEANLYGVDQGWILFGVKDDKTIVGTDIMTSGINKLKKSISEHTSPRMNFTKVHRVHTDKGDVLMWEVPKAPLGQVVSWKGHAYGRNGESMGGLQDEKRNRISNQVIADWSMQTIDEASVDDLSAAAIAKARVEYKKKNPKLATQVDAWDDMTFLNKSKVAIRGKLTYAAILLLGKPESEYYINPSTSKISWILKDKEGVTKDYEHFTCPLILAVDDVASKVRNLKYRYIVDGSLFPQEVDQYDAYIIREALHNCIAHQDYTLGGKVSLIEKEDGFLMFSNQGEFMPKSVEYVVTSDAPEDRYRNKCLSDAMVSYGMIDTVGSGIKRMFIIQRNKFFPLPDYDTSDNKVVVTVAGKVLDLNYARKLATVPDLSLQDIILLDKVAKRKKLTTEQAKALKVRKLIEGRRPNYHISSEVALAIGEQDKYIKQRGIDNDYCRKIILDYLEKFGEGHRKDFEKVLLSKLPELLNKEQKKTKVKNNLQALRKDNKIYLEGKKWKLVNSSN
jgi:ATP-dependent DNA helicase RecG